MQELKRNTKHWSVLTLPFPLSLPLFDLWVWVSFIHLVCVSVCESKWGKAQRYFYFISNKVVLEPIGSWWEWLLIMGWCHSNFLDLPNKILKIEVSEWRLAQISRCVADCGERLCRITRWRIFDYKPKGSLAKGSKERSTSSYFDLSRFGWI